LPCRDIGGGNISRFHAEFLDDVVEQIHRRAEQTLRRNDVIARLQHAHHASQNRRHPARRRHTLLRTFQRSQAFLEHGHSRIGEARVDVARLFADKTFSRLRCTFEHETGSEEHRLAVLAKLAALCACVYCQGFRLIVLF
jgi:hypothetical protein